jgi:hypothetical protein
MFQMPLETYIQDSSRLGILKPLAHSRARELLFLISMGVLAAVLSTVL